MQTARLELLICATGLMLSVVSILLASFAGALLGVIFTAIGFGMLIMRYAGPG